MSFLGTAGSVLGGAASGLGSLGEQMGKGDIDAQKVLWDRQQDTIKNNIAQQSIDIQKTGQQQSYNLAQQQHELYRQQMIDNGYKDMGVTQSGLDESGNPKYMRNFVNVRDGSTRQFPVQGLPLDSPQATLNHLQQLRGLKDEKGNRLFSDVEAGQIAFKMPMLYRQGPAEQYKSFMGVGNEQYPDDSDKAQKLGQKLWDEYVGKAGYFHYGAGGGMDTRGFTAGEKREFDALDRGYQNMEANAMRLASAQMANTLDPSEQAAISRQTMSMMNSIETERLNKFNDIQGRRGGKGGQVNPNAVQLGSFSKSAWLAKYPKGDINAAIADATKAGVPIVP